MILLIQILFAVAILGIIYTLWSTTRVYGGLIGGALKWIGVGMMFFAVESLDRVLGSYGLVQSVTWLDEQTAHNILLLLGLAFSAVGFSKLTKIAR